MTKCVSILCDDMQHYFVIKTDMAVPDKVSFIVKIEYKQEQEGVVTTNTLQILSNVFLQTLSHFLNQYYNESYSVSRNEVLQSLLQNQSISQKHWNKQRSELIQSAENICLGLESLDILSRSIPLRICFNKIKTSAFKSRKIIMLENILSITLKKNKRQAFNSWRNYLALWKRKISSIKKLLHWNKMKLTSKVLNKWYNQFKYEESIMQSVCHRDYIISMYEILGNTKDSKQFSDKYHSVFTFMLNRYLKQWMTPELKNNLKKVVLMLKKDKTSFVMVDFTEEERQKATHMKHNHKFISPIKVEISSPSHSGRVTPVRSQIFIEEQDSLAPVSPQNYSFIVD